MALCDYRLIVGMFRAVARRKLPMFSSVPCIIFMAGIDKLIFPDLNMGICGQNMNLAVLGLGSCRSNFVQWSPMFRK